MLCPVSSESFSTSSGLLAETLLHAELLVPVCPAAETVNQDSFQASRKKPVIWVKWFASLYQNSNFVLLLSSNHLKHISPLKREKLERSKETALPPWTVVNEQTQRSTHTAAGFPGRRRWLIKRAPLGSIKREVLRRRVLGEGPKAFMLRTTLHICASGCLLPLQAQVQSTAAEERAPCPVPSVCLSLFLTWCQQLCHRFWGFPGLCPATVLLELMVIFPLQFPLEPTLTLGCSGEDA